MTEFIQLVIVIALLLWLAVWANKKIGSGEWGKRLAELANKGQWRQFFNKCADPEVWRQVADNCLAWLSQFMAALLEDMKRFGAGGANLKGVFGEAIVAQYLERFSQSDGYHRYANLILPDGRIGTTEVDFALFSPYGIFVIEVKHYGGWIFGDEHSAKWTQSFNRRSKKQFQNPLRQNYKHIAVLRDLTGLNEKHFHSVVVFTGGAAFKTPMPDNVVYARDLPDVISARKTKILSDKQVNNAIAAVLKMAKTEPGAQQKHADDLRHRHG